MRTLPPTCAACVSDLRIKLPDNCMIFSGSSKSTHTASGEIVKLTYYISSLCQGFRTHVTIPRHMEYV